MIIDQEKKVLLRFKELSGQYTGLLKNFLVYENGTKGKSNLNIVTGELPQYTKLFLGPNHNMSYHISGYGNSFQEAMQRFLGESIERYAGVTGHIYNRNIIFKATYSEAAKYGNILSIDKFNFLKDTQLKKMHTSNKNYWTHGLRKNDEISWVVVPDFIHPEKKDVVPASMFFSGYLKDGVFTPSFSTGTACHEDMYKALKNALIEYIQIDAFVHTFYSSKGQTEILINSLPHNLLQAIRNIMGELYNKYTIKLIDYSNNAIVSLPIVGVYLIAKNKHQFPSIVFGVQGAFSPKTAIFRGIQEAMAVYEMTNNMIIATPDFFKIERKKGKNDFFDLDTNVAYYADPHNYIENENNIIQRITQSESYKTFSDNTTTPICKSTNDQLCWLQSKLENKINMVGYLDITPPNLKNQNIKVIRTCIPELQHMPFPSFPYLNHSRYREEKEHVNILHPLA